MKSTLHVALQDGFANDEVVVRIDGEEVFRRRDVSTDYRISLATAFEREVVHGRRTLEVELVGRRLSRAFEVEHAGATHVAVSILEGSLQLRVSDRPFGYV